MIITLPKLPATMDVTFSDKKMNWQDAMDWAKKQGGRLPTKFELQALAESEEIPEDKKADWYWSASSVSYLTDFAWGVNLYYGITGTNGKYYAGNYGALCLR